jgi:hypothetical protein
VPIEEVAVDSVKDIHFIFHPNRFKTAMATRRAAKRFSSIVPVSPVEIPCQLPDLRVVMI